MGKAARKRERSTPPPQVRQRRGIDFRVVGIVVLVLGAGGFAASRLTGLTKPVLDTAHHVQAHTQEDYPAPEFTGIGTWINSRPLTVTSLRGHVTLVDFWTYSCVNCIRTLPYLRSFYSQYHTLGFDIVGVHTPEFSFEKDPSNVRAAVKEHQVVWPVAMDNEMGTWNAYGNQYWPHVYLLDAQGHVRYDFIGEGNDVAIQSAIRTLLAAPGVTVPSAAPLPAQNLSGDMTPEIYLGYQRGEYAQTLANPEGYAHDRPVTYAEPSAQAVRTAGSGGVFWLSGRWQASLEHVTPLGPGGEIILNFSATDAYIVAGPAAGGAPGVLAAQLDGHPIPPAEQGEALHGGHLTLGFRDLYHLVHLPSPGEHVLTLTVSNPNVAVYTFTFG
jgi:thiol-disulfide isomerase/thioredoxin